MMDAVATLDLATRCSAGSQIERCISAFEQALTMLFLGIDGGGTRCRARIRDAAGEMLGEGEGGPANIYQDISGAASSILDAAKAASVQAGLSAGRLGELRAGLGLAGIIAADSATRLRSAGLPFASLSVVVDAQAACLGAHAGGDGGIVITGTGSAGFAIAGGVPRGIGGWGFHLGDDGSGAMMGREAARRAVLALDGMTPWSDVLERVLAVLGREQTVLTGWAKSARPADYAQLAPLVLAGAAAGDRHGVEIVRQASEAIAMHARRLVAMGAPRLSLVGGLAEPMMAYLAPDVRPMFVPPLADAVDGAILLAKGEVRAGEPFVNGVSRA